MRKQSITVAVTLALAAAMLNSSCIGRFALTNKVLTWNKGVGSKFVNELVFVMFWILPVYELCALADILVVNSIEFWSGKNPVEESSMIIDGRDARYLVERDATGYTVTNLDDRSRVRFDYDEASRSWSVERNGERRWLFTFVDDTHVILPDAAGQTRQVELSQAGVMAYRDLVQEQRFVAMR